MDINSVDALLHVSDLSHGRVKKPSDLVTIGQKLKVKITKIDPKTNRVSASIKALKEDPYMSIEKKYQVGKIYEGTVTKIMDYGCFVRIEDGSNLLKFWVTGNSIVPATSHITAPNKNK